MQQRRTAKGLGLHLEQHGIRPHLIGIEPQLYNAAKANIDEVVIAVFGERPIPFADRSADIVIGCKIFYRATAPQHSATLSEMARVLKPDGAAYIDPVTVISHERTRALYHERGIYFGNLSSNSAYWASFFGEEEFGKLGFAENIGFFIPAGDLEELVQDSQIPWRLENVRRFATDGVFGIHKIR